MPVLDVQHPQEGQQTNFHSTKQDRFIHNYMPAILERNLGTPPKNFPITWVQTYHLTINTLRSILVKPKNQDPVAKKCNVIYHLTCSDCQAKYIGQTGRAFGTRLKEHPNLCNSLNNFAVAEHMCQTGHHFEEEEANIIPARRVL